jgi:hypothetical protein
MMTLQAGDRIAFEASGLRRMGFVRDIFPHFILVEVTPHTNYVFENRTYRETIPRNDCTYRILKIY